MRDEQHIDKIALNEITNTIIINLQFLVFIWQSLNLQSLKFDYF